MWRYQSIKRDWNCSFKMISRSPRGQWVNEYPPAPQRRWSFRQSLYWVIWVSLRLGSWTIQLFFNSLLSLMTEKTSNQTSKLRITVSLRGDPPETSEFSARRNSNLDIFSLPWSHYDNIKSCLPKWKRLICRCIPFYGVLFVTSLD